MTPIFASPTHTLCGTGLGKVRKVARTFARTHAFTDRCHITCQFAMEIWFNEVTLEEVDDQPVLVIGLASGTRRLWGVSQQLASLLGINITTFNTRCTETYIVSDTSTLHQLRWGGGGEGCGWWIQVNFSTSSFPSLSLWFIYHSRITHQMGY